MNLRRRVAAVNSWMIGLAVVALPILGCSGRRSDKWRDGLPPAFPSVGTVTYRGKPLAEATVVFLAEVPGKNRSLAAVANTDSEGRFLLRTYRDGDGAIAGQHQVMIRKSIAVSPDGKPLVPNEQGDILDVPTEKHLIPEKYASTDTSGLSAEVVPKRRNEFMFALE
jgi:hypothetical protein